MSRRALVVASFLLIAACSATDSPSPSPSPAGNATPSPTIPATSRPSAIPDTGWRRHLVPQLDGVVRINAMAAGEPGLVAVGQSATGQTSWVSSDGVLWKAAADLSDFDAHDLIGLPHDMLAVGDAVAAGASAVSLASAPGGQRAGPVLAAACEPGPTLSAAVWSSRDGLHWERLPDDPAFAGVPMLSTAPTSQGLGFTAIGGNQCNQPDLKPRSASWFSKTGTDWARDIDLEGGLMFDAVSDHLAVGMREDTLGCATNAEPLVFNREEVGTREERAWHATDPGLGAGYVSDAAAGPDRIVAIVRVQASPADCEGRPVVWLSVDGSWSRVDLPSGVEISRIQEVESDDTSWFVGAGKGGIWGSRDGLAWGRLGGDSDNLLAVGGSREGLVALGVDQSGSGVAWTGPTALP